jgi:hypothetical protein
MVRHRRKSPTGWRNVSVNALILVATVLVALLGFEIALRQLLDPQDFLTPDLVRDGELRYRIAPGSGGHDEWGFRNHGVPDRADIVAIGDSMTYGLSAPSTKSWPAWLAKLSNHTVYNLGVGGYGPVEYAKILESRAMKLAPQVAVIGIYLGNDIYDAYVSATGNQDPEIEKLFLPVDTLGQVRNWLSRHSMLYGAAKAAFPQFVDFVRSRDFRHKLGEGVVQAELWGQAQLLTTNIALRAMDMRDDRIVAGLAKTRDEIRSMTNACSLEKIICYFVLIPTKQRVLQPLIEPSLSDEDRAAIADLAGKEAALSESLTATISSLGPEPIDPLEDLRSAARLEPIYPATDGHPNGDGYEIIARSVWRVIRQDLAVTGAAK